jgi:hypothetical protein
LVRGFYPLKPRWCWGLRDQWTFPSRSRRTWRRCWEFIQWL